jgi:predicted secreted protein
LDPPDGTGDAVSTVRLAVGEERTLPLAAAGSVGYAWTVRVSGTPGVVEASIRSAPRPPARAGALPYGGSHPQLLVLRALRSGQAEVRCELGRPFGPPRPPRARQDLIVIVAG